MLLTFLTSFFVFSLIDSIHCGPLYDSGWNSTEFAFNACPAFEAVDHATIKYIERDFEVAVRIVCDPGYDLDGLQTSQMVYCIEGKWATYGKIECLQRCPEPPHLDHGRFEVDTAKDSDGVYNKGAVATFFCKEGYYLSPNESKYRVCVKGIWTGPVATCLKRCPRPHEIANGYFVEEKFDGGTSVLEGYDVGQRLHYGCKSGYGLIGASVQQCLDDGTWSPKIGPVCSPQVPGNTPTTVTSQKTLIKSGMSVLSNTSNAFVSVDDSFQQAALAEEEAVLNQYKANVGSPLLGGGFASSTNPFLSDDEPTNVVKAEPILDLFGEGLDDNNSGLMMSGGHQQQQHQQSNTTTGGGSALDDLLGLGNPFADAFSAPASTPPVSSAIDLFGGGTTAPPPSSQSQQSTGVAMTTTTTMSSQQQQPSQMWQANGFPPNASFPPPQTIATGNSGGMTSTVAAGGGGGGFFNANEPSVFDQQHFQGLAQHQQHQQPSVLTHQHQQQHPVQRPPAQSKLLTGDLESSLTSLVENLTMDSGGGGSGSGRSSQQWNSPKNQPTSGVATATAHNKSSATGIGGGGMGAAGGVGGGGGWQPQPMAATNAATYRPMMAAAAAAPHQQQQQQQPLMGGVQPMMMQYPTMGGNMMPQVAPSPLQGSPKMTPNMINTQQQQQQPVVKQEVNFDPFGDL